MKCYFSTKPDKLSLIPKPHVRRRDITPTILLLISMNMCAKVYLHPQIETMHAHACVLAHIHIHTQA